MDADEIQMELRADVKTVPRDKVARILWLHPESLETGNQAEPANETVQSNFIQALLSDGNRVTFVPEQVESNVLSGTSPLLGFGRVELQTVDQLFMGLAIDQATADLPFQWKLKKSADPLAPKEGAEGSEGGTEGLESALVGKPAPEIELKSLDGQQFQLTSKKGKIIILDFWASWCGPCLQVMPQVDRVAHEFEEQGVLLFAVNLEETPEKVKAAMERLKLSTTVLLDQDGRVAEKYGATSIPQTVIIDREGKVVRLYVGGSSRFDEQLRTALKSVLSGEAPKAE
jgi:thiol-disulfide isomerase/thioredoxin